MKWALNFFQNFYITRFYLMVDMGINPFPAVEVDGQIAGKDFHLDLSLLNELGSIPQMLLTKGHEFLLDAFSAVLPGAIETIKACVDFIPGLGAQRKKKKAEEMGIRTAEFDFAAAPLPEFECEDSTLDSPGMYYPVPQVIRMSRVTRSEPFHAALLTFGARTAAVRLSTLGGCLPCPGGSLRVRSR